jgi:hypothetical protein
VQSLLADLARALDPLASARQTGFVPDPWQREVLESDDDRILLNVHRQGGKSVTVSHLAVNAALTDPGLIITGSPSQRQSGELFRKIVSTFQAIEPKPDIQLLSATQLELASGARIVSLPGSEATVRGFSAPKLILLDEAARISDDLYAAFRPMLAAGAGRLIALSTPWGRRGWFFNGFEYGGERWRRFKVAASECPRISKEFLGEELREIGPLRFRSEYCCEFVDSEDAFFPSHLIEQALSAEVLPLWS